MNSAFKFLSDVRLTGLYVLEPVQSQRLEAYAEKLSFALLPTDIGNISEKHEILKKIGQDLGFPDWYEPNLDALHDCLTDFSWHPANGYMLLIRSIDRAETFLNSEEFKETMISVTEFWQAQEIAFWIFLEKENPAADSRLKKISM